MARALLAMYGEDKVHIFSFLVQCKVQHSDAPMLRHWELIEEVKEEKPDGNPRGGFYKITEAGIDFVDKNFFVPKYVFLYNNTVQGFSVEKISIIDALGDKFNYDELMSEAVKLKKIKGEPHEG